MRTFSAAAFLLLCAASTTVLDASAQSRLGRRTVRGASLSMNDVASHAQQAAGIRGGGPANDQCANAVALAVNAAGLCPGAAVAGDNLGATSDSDPACDVTASFFEDVWYVFNSGNYSSVTIDVAVGTMADLVVEVFEGGCAGTSVACTIGQLSTVVAATPGTNYAIRIASNNEFGAGGTFDICLSGGGGGTAPANDLCDDATPIAVNPTCVPTQSNMQGATQSLAPATCSTFTAGSASDVWYTFTATGTSTTVEATGLGDATTGLDPVVEVFSGTCAAPTSMGCIDATVRGETESITVATVSGTTYLYRIYYWPYAAAQTEFAYTTCVYGAGGGTAPANDLCDDATQIAVNPTCVPTQANMQGATQSLAPATCSTFTAGSANDVWYTFTAVGTSTTVEATGGGDATTGLDPVVEVFSGTCLAPTSLGCIDATVRGETESITVTTVAGTTYLYRVYYWPYAAAQTVFDYTTCVYGDGGGTAPVNDDCSGAVAQSLAIGGSVVFNGDNTGATDTEALGFGSVWESFTTTECANITLSYCGTTPAFGNAFLNLFIGCPFTSFIQSTSFETTSCGDNNVTIQYANVPAGTYYYAVLTDAGATGPYTITVSAVACPPPDNYCTAGAVSVQFEKISNVTFVDINNTSAGNAGYEDFTAQTASVVAGVSYPISVTIAGGYATDQVLAWIDWDHSSTFEPAEQVFVSAIGVGPHTGSVAVPLTATAGPTRMRVRLHDTYDLGVDYFNTPNPTPCDTSTFGQVEDYTVDMIGIITGVNEASAASWSVFPNPNDGDFVVRYAGRDGRATIEVLDMTGRAVHAEQRAVAAGSNLQLALAGKLAAGTYALRITTADGSEERRIVVR